MSNNYKGPKIQIRTARILIVLILIIIVGIEAYGRAGGGGGSSSSGGSGDGGLVEIVIYLFMALPFPFNFIAVAAIIVLAYLGKKKNQQKSVLNKMPGHGSNINSKNFQQYLQHHKDFNLSDFEKKVRTAFLEIQKAWEKKDLSEVRHYISDGVYQRFNTQFKMMDMLDQTNKLDEIRIRQIQIADVEYDDTYEIMHVAIQAGIKDRFISKRFPKLNTGGWEEFVEYWSFIKKRDVHAKDIYHNKNCPQCGGALPEKAAEVSKCPYCNTISNTGEYDWILAEITQADDFIGRNNNIKGMSDLANRIKSLRQENEDFSKQLMEDKASNGYLQIQTAMVMKQPAIMRRFVTDHAYEKLQAQFPEDNIVFNRIFLSDVTLVGAFQEADKNILAFSVSCSYQRVKLEDGRAKLIDLAVMRKNEVLLMSRDKDASVASGSLYAHMCPSCGAPVADTTDLKCAYCGVELNSTKNEWIVSDLLSVYQFNQFAGSKATDEFSYAIKPEKLDSLYKVRDYAFNNMLLMIAADGQFEEEEMKFARKMAKKWGYNVNRIQPVFEMAKAGRLYVKMPEKEKEKVKIYKMLEKVARIDANVSKEEASLLNQIRENFSISTT